ncbi:S-adenosyl-L-methionine-dependent methyltransferase [Aspergillus stella-maris]|uniref:S-adenosyl-L-methionine-dependent methyltransferase n=1 Tax=Aspergillus stella-maris TaxID=1810926 RepID=UPI003CCE29CC
MDTLTLKQRAADIFRTANSLADDLALGGHPEPSFEHGLAPHLYGDASESTGRTLKQELFRMVDELRALLTEPTSTLGTDTGAPTLSLLPIVRLGIADNFPEPGTTVTDLAKSVNLRESIVRRLLKHSSTYHVFYESQPDFYIHTAASRHLCDNQGMRDWICVGGNEVLPGTLKIADAIAEYPDSEEPEHCGWSLANSTGEPVFRALAKEPPRAAKIASTMKWQMQNSGFSPTYLADIFPWETSGEDSDDAKLTVIDVGGSIGHISRALATHPHPSATKTKFIIQDMPDIVAQGEILLPDDLMDRVTFQAHDFFTPQPKNVHGADVYLLRSVLHDWSDKYATIILRNLIPGLKKGAKILINERIVPGFHEAHYLVERHFREFDMHMLGFQNALERTKEDWEGLIRGADERFQVKGVQQQKGSLLAVIEVTWVG